MQVTEDVGDDKVTPAEANHPAFVAAADAAADATVVDATAATDATAADDDATAVSCPVLLKLMPRTSNPVTGT